MSTKKAIVIGATSGIGKGLAKLLAKNNYLVGIVGRRSHLLEELRMENLNSYLIKSIDITKLDTINSRLEELVNELGGLDLLILSSGTGDLNQDLDFDIEKRTICTNVIGFTYVSDWAFNLFEKQKYGHLVAISSIGGIRGSKIAPAYNASKAYQINYLEALRQKAYALKLPIYVSDIRPGFVDTDMAKGEGKFWVATVEKASKQIFDAINKKVKVVYITKRWQLIAIILKLLPRSIYNRL